MPNKITWDGVPQAPLGAPVDGTCLVSLARSLYLKQLRTRSHQIKPSNETTMCGRDYETCLRSPACDFLIGHITPTAVRRKAKLVENTELEAQCPLNCRQRTTLQFYTEYKVVFKTLTIYLVTARTQDTIYLLHQVIYERNCTIALR